MLSQLRVLGLAAALFLAFSTIHPAAASSTQQSAHLLKAKARLTPGQQFLKKELAKLLKFKNSESFAFYSFGLGGPHNKWLKSVEAHRDDANFSITEKIAVNQLSSLGMEYMRRKGAESDLTKFLRAEIDKAISREANGA